MGAPAGILGSLNCRQGSQNVTGPRGGKLNPRLSEPTYQHAQSSAKVPMGKRPVFGTPEVSPLSVQPARQTMTCFLFPSVEHMLGQVTPTPKLRGDKYPREKTEETSSALSGSCVLLRLSSTFCCCFAFFRLLQIKIDMTQCNCLFPPSKPLLLHF